MFLKQKQSPSNHAETTVPGLARYNTLRTHLEDAFDTPVTSSLLEDGAPVNRFIQSILQNLNVEQATIAETRTTVDSRVAQLLVKGLTKAITSKERDLPSLVDESQRAKNYHLVQGDVDEQSVYTAVAAEKVAAVVTTEAGDTAMLLPTKVGGVVLSLINPAATNELHIGLVAA